MKRFFLFAFLLCSVLTSLAQTTQPYWQDVQTIKQFDQMYKPPVHPVLFTGSSSIRKWDNLQQDFPGYTLMNRGIGGAVVNDIRFYLNDLVFVYEPKQIVLYVGENNLPDAQATPDTILKQTIQLFNEIRAKLPTVPIVYISLKPSPAREQYISKAIQTNALIKDFLSRDPYTTYVDIFSLMLTRVGKPRTELFVEDMLHMNEKGYAIWRKAVKPYLKK